MNDLSNPSNAAIMQRLNEIEANLTSQLKELCGSPVENQVPEYLSAVLGEGGLYSPSYLTQLNNLVREKHPSGFLIPAHSHHINNSPITLIGGIYWWKIFEDRDDISLDAIVAFKELKTDTWGTAQQYYASNTFLIPVGGTAPAPFALYTAICPGQYAPNTEPPVQTDAELEAQIRRLYERHGYL
jgi:hypothetical protein